MFAICYELSYSHSHILFKDEAKTKKRNLQFTLPVVSSKKAAGRRFSMDPEHHNQEPRAEKSPLLWS